MGPLTDPSLLTPAQRAVLDAWPAFEAAAKVKWCSISKLSRAFYGAELEQLDNRQAGQLADLLRTATTRLARLRPLPAVAGSWS